MAKVESKSRVNINIEVISRDGLKKGTFNLSSGNFYYFRANAKTETKRYSYQQLLELIEADIENNE